MAREFSGNAMRSLNLFHTLARQFVQMFQMKNTYPDHPSERIETFVSPN